MEYGGTHVMETERTEMVQVLDTERSDGTKPLSKYRVRMYRGNRNYEIQTGIQ
jgi:hypothetical protein